MDLMMDMMKQIVKEIIRFLKMYYPIRIYPELTEEDRKRDRERLDRVWKIMEDAREGKLKL